MRAALLLLPLLSSCTWIIFDRLRDNDLCGNGIAQTLLDEECDGQDLQDQTCLSLDPRFVSGQLSCSLSCTFDTSGCQAPLSCGDGVLDAFEQCDDQNFSGDDGCSAVCQLEEGFTCSETLPSVCQPTCGDGLVVGAEQCDDQNDDDDDGCLSSCQAAPGFECAGDPVVCFLPRCGDGTRDDGEQCDDGGFRTGDGCDAQCRIEPGFVCGAPFDGCFLPNCGDGQLDLGEQCDDGCGDGLCDLSDNNDGCESSCRFICGGESNADLAFFFQDQCYLGFDAPLSFEEALSSCEARSSHLVVVTSLEEDALLSALVPRFVSGALSVWLGLIEGNAPGNLGGFVWVTDEPLASFQLFLNNQPLASADEDCGLRTQGLGWKIVPCDEAHPFVCESERRCGDGIVGNTPGEACDDGNNLNGDGCRADCAGAERCGDGVLDDDPALPHAEACDDGNGLGGDGCSRVCQLEE